MECLFADLKPSTGYIYGCRCNRCAEWATEDRKRRKTGTRLPCQHPGCPKPKRSGSGARYCDEHAKPARILEAGRRYQARQQSARGLEIKAKREDAALLKRSCVKCGAEWKNPGFGNKYSLCQTCRSQANLLVKRAGHHNVPADTLLQWLDQGTCEICSAPLRLAGFHQDKPFNIDHDHGCCPGEYGCEQCVRGLLCTPCNTALGRIEALQGQGLLERALNYIGYKAVEHACQEPETLPGNLSPAS